MRALLCVVLVTGCIGDGPSRPVRGIANTPVADPGARWDAEVTALAARRVELAKRYAAAHTSERVAVLAEASAAFLAAYDAMVVPWLGTPWGLGSNSTSLRPHQPGMTVGCSYF